MSHFVPVLTRTGDLGRAIAWLPAGAQMAGLIAVAAMQGLVPRWLLHAAAAVDLVLAAILLTGSRGGCARHWARRTPAGAGTRLPSVA